MPVHEILVITPHASGECLGKPAPRRSIALACTTRTHLKVIDRSLCHNLPLLSHLMHGNIINDFTRVQLVPKAQGRARIVTMEVSSGHTFLITRLLRKI